MRLFSSRGFAAATVMVAVLAPVATAHAAGPPASLPGDRPGVRVSPSDVAASNRKVSAAYSVLITMWNAEFRRIGARFAAPRVRRYDGDVYTSCGLIQSNNAEYCAGDNTIYYDQVFVAGMAKIAGRSLDTDGDMAGVGIIAHEMGHAVAIQLGHESRNSYENESTADCLAGAFTKQSGRDGLLEAGDIDEAFYGISMAGDPTPEPTGNARVDARLQARLAHVAHGTSDQRLSNFRRGLNGGSAACLADFR